MTKRAYAQAHWLTGASPGSQTLGDGIFRNERNTVLGRARVQLLRAL